ncbi:MAG: MBL fold metallo-hydrolase [Myxococcales bacterium]|nr:MBL fold metallo-hydrolase [Myxococcales bacterium]
MRVRILASGSGGNLSLYEHDGFALLVDAGVDPGGLASRLRSVGADYTRPDALVVTHGHADHCAHARAYAEGAGIPTYMTDATMRVVRPASARHVFRYSAKEPFRVGPFEVRPCAVPHDVPQVALRIESDDGCAALIATDLGEVPAELRALLAGVQLAMIESNHDKHLLEIGPYPRFLKRRVGGPRGHLNNDQCAELLRNLPASVETVVLMHLSEKNNRPEVALDCAAEALSDRSTTLLAAKQYDRQLFDLVPRGREGATLAAPDVARVEAIARAIAAPSKRRAIEPPNPAQLALKL